jgi:hypothetical protein
MPDMIHIALVSALLAWNPPADETAIEGGGKVVLSIGEVPEVAERGKPVDVAVEVASQGAREIAGTLSIGLEPSWVLEGLAERLVKVPAGGKTVVQVKIAAGLNTHGAHYPLHARLRVADGGVEKQLHAVRVFETRLGPPPPPDEPLVVPAGGSLDLSAARAVRVSWEWFGKPRRAMLFGWTGSDPECRLDFSTGGQADRGGSRPAISVHPPWWTGAGTMFADYRVSLPAAGPVRFEAAGALRDIAPAEPPSDGVTYRVSAAPADGKGEPPSDGAFRLLAEKHIAARTWTPFVADLSDLAGKTVWLRLETHPGPKRDTTCDGAFWGSPRIACGPPPPAAAGAEREIDRKEVHGFKDDWTVDGEVLPPYGFLAKGKDILVVRSKGLTMARDSRVEFIEKDGFSYRVEVSSSGPGKITPLPGTRPPPEK